MFSTADGWGSQYVDEWSEAEIKIRAWNDMNSVYPFSYNEHIGENAVLDKHTFPNMPAVSIDDDFVSLTVIYSIDNSIFPVPDVLKYILKTIWWIYFIFAMCKYLSMD